MGNVNGKRVPHSALDEETRTRVAHEPATPARAPAWLILTLLCIVQLMLIMNTTVTTGALSLIQRDLNFSSGNLQWVASGYSLTFGGFLLFGSRVGDSFGSRRLFQVGLIVFLLASLFGGITQSQALLVGGRLLQGIGAALVSPTAFFLLTDAFMEEKERNRMLGVWGAASAGGGAVGIIVGSLLAEITWRWVLFINVPICMFAFALTPLLTESRGRATHHLDIPGALFITASLITLVYGLSQGATVGNAEVSVLVPVMGSIVLLIAFLIVEARTARPLVPLRIFLLRNQAGGYIVTLLMFGVLAAGTFFLSLYMQKVLGYSPIETGIAFLPQVLLTMLITNIAPRFIAFLGVRGALGMAMITLVMASFLFAGIGPEGHYFTEVLPGMPLLALGLGGGFVAVSIAVTTGVADRDQGLTSGLFIAAQMIGAAIGLAILVLVTTLPNRTNDLITGFHHAFIGMAIFSLVALGVTCVAVRQPRSPGTTPDRFGHRNNNV